METEAWMPLEPGLYLLAGVHSQVVADDVDQGDRGWGLTINLEEQFDEVLLPLPGPANANDVSASRVERRKQLKGSASLILMFQSDWHGGASSPSGHLSGSRLQGGLLVHRKDALVRLQLARVELADLFSAPPKLGVSWCFRIQPVVNSPRFEPIARQNPLHRLRRDPLHDTVPLKGSRQLGACPQR